MFNGLKLFSSFALLALPAAAFQSQTIQNVDSTSPSTSTRREWFTSSLAVIGATVLAPALPASAKALSQEEADKENIVKGYNQLQYLLNHWVEETTICKTGGDYNAKVCDRTPLKVMDYLGYRSTTSPLFKADKTMLRLYSLVPASKDAEYLEAMERYSENADEASGMAYISSWGEANPGGGKDRVELFIERAKKNVVTSRDCLATVMNILDIKP